MEINTISELNLSRKPNSPFREVNQFGKRPYQSQGTATPTRINSPKIIRLAATPLRVNMLQSTINFPKLAPRSPKSSQLNDTAVRPRQLEDITNIQNEMSVPLSPGTASANFLEDATGHVVNQLVQEHPELEDNPLIRSICSSQINCMDDSSPAKRRKTLSGQIETQNSESYNRSDAHSSRLNQSHGNISANEDSSRRTIRLPPIVTGRIFNLEIKNSLNAQENEGRSDQYTEDQVQRIQQIIVSHTQKSNASTVAGHARFGPKSFIPQASFPILAKECGGSISLADYVGRGNHESITNDPLEMSSLDSFSRNHIEHLSREFKRFGICPKEGKEKWREIEW